MAQSVERGAGWCSLTGSFIDGMRPNEAVSGLRTQRGEIRCVGAGVIDGHWVVTFASACNVSIGPWGVAGSSKCQSVRARTATRRQRKHHIRGRIPACDWGQAVMRGPN